MRVKTWLITVMASTAFLCLPLQALAAWTTTIVDSSVHVGNIGQYNSIAIGNDGLPVISYYDGVTFSLNVVHCGDAVCSSGNTITTVDGAGDIGQYTSITIGDDGFPVISYFDNDNDDLKVAHCGNAACSSGNTFTTVDGTGGKDPLAVGEYSSIVIGDDAFPIISYFDSTNSDLKVIHCGNATCSSGNTITTVDSDGFVGQYTSIAIGNDDLAVISYFDNTNSDLKVTHCGNAACSSGNTTTTVDSDAGSFSSIAIGNDGFPVISYFRGIDLDLKVTHCGNATCSSGNTITTVDSTGSVGKYTAITIGDDGLPLISYYDETNGYLKVAYCGNAACSSGNTTTTVDSAEGVGFYTSIASINTVAVVISYFDNGNRDLKFAYEPIEVAATPTVSANRSTDTTSNDPAAGITGLVLKDGVSSQTHAGTVQSGPVITIPAAGSEAISFSTKPPDADQVHRVYSRVNGREYDFKDATVDPNNPNFTATLTLPPGSYPYTLTADYGFTTLSQQGVIIVEPSSTNLITRINELFRSVFTRNPTAAENTYWQTRINQGDKTTFADLIGAMQWQQLFGQ